MKESTYQGVTVVAACLFFINDGIMLFWFWYGYRYNKGFSRRLSPPTINVSLKRAAIFTLATHIMGCFWSPLIYLSYGIPTISSKNLAVVYLELLFIMFATSRIGLVYFEKTRLGTTFQGTQYELSNKTNNCLLSCIIMMTVITTLAVIGVLITNLNSMVDSGLVLAVLSYLFNCIITMITVMYMTKLFSSKLFNVTVNIRTSKFRIPTKSSKQSSIVSPTMSSTQTPSSPEASSIGASSSDNTCTISSVVISDPELSSTQKRLLHTVSKQALLSFVITVSLVVLAIAVAIEWLFRNESRPVMVFCDVLVLGFTICLICSMILSFSFMNRQFDVICGRCHKYFWEGYEEKARRFIADRELSTQGTDTHYVQMTN